MKIVGAVESAEGVHTIDVWHSSRRQCWIVERRDADGNVLGQILPFVEEDDAAECIAEWLRSHPETHLVGHGLAAVAMAARRAA